MNDPYISVVICAYNLAHMLPDAIESVFHQEFPESEREIIVVNDGSKDGTADVLKRYGDKVRVVHQINQGMGESMRHAIRIARGQIIAPLDADDSWRPQKLRRVAQAFRQSQDVSVLAHRLQYADKDLHPRDVFDGAERDREVDLESVQWCKINRQGQLFASYVDFLTGGSNYAFRRSAVLDALEKVAPPRLYADTFYYMLAAAVGKKAIYLAEPLGLYRLHGTNNSFAPDPHSLKILKPRAALITSCLSIDLSRRASLKQFFTTWELITHIQLTIMDSSTKRESLKRGFIALSESCGKVSYRVWLRCALLIFIYVTLPRRMFLWLWQRRPDARRTARHAMRVLGQAT